VQKQGRKKEGVAIFWHDAKLNMVKHETVGLDIPLGDESGAATLWCVSMAILLSADV
jgi:hypothetical protein